MGLVVFYNTQDEVGIKPVEFDGFKNEAGSNAFVLSPSKWITVTNATGLSVKRGRYGGTYAQ